MISYWHEHEALVEPAFDLSLRNAHSLCDCLYLALAVRLEGRVVTADRAFARKFASGEQAERVVLPTDFARSV